jgi:SPP1 gp7 family putative phage head morphogenesis protein|nr:MAG TPA: minor capsid protein [Caudoviricetes sp.]
MARKPINYWEQRSTELMKRLEKGTENTINSLIKAYEQATKDINKEISRIFKNYAKDSGLNRETLIQLLNKKESETHYKNLLEVINNNITDESIKKKLLAKYNAPAYSYRISRYEALQQNIDIELKKLANIEQQITEIRYIDTIKDAYYHNIYDIQKGTGLGFSFAQIDDRTINLLLNKNWIDRANFSERIWQNSERLGNYLKTNLTAATMSGKSINKIAQELSEYMNVGLYNATRLVRTEVNHFANEAEMLSYEELEIEKYRYIATLDNRTCEHCAELDNKIFNIKDRKPGKNYPPIHANDRCTTVAEFDDDTTDVLQRRARDENGNPILVPQDMNYKEWKAKYVDITQREKDAIREYSGPTAYTLNEKLRNNMKLNKSESELIQSIDSGLNKLPNYNKVTYRQIGFDFQGKEEYNNFINKHKNNKYINYGQYTSSSKHYGDYEVKDKLKVEITIQGKTGKDIRLLAGVPEENEVLFGKDVLFEVIKVDDNKIWLKEV